ncbi:MAG: transcription termination/antitermination protein NusG [Dehalococcoidia bacterium]
MPATDAETADEAAQSDQEAEQEATPNDGRRWYIVQTYSGYENKVKMNLDQRIRTMDMGDRIFEVVIPIEEEIEIHQGQRRTVQKKMFPGYVFVQMVMNDDSWYVVRNTPGVTGFAGSTIEDRSKPTPLDDEEVGRILRQMQTAQPRINIGFKLGDTVRVSDGPFADFLGTVDEINFDKGKVRVLVTMFGRETAIEMDFLGVEKQ